MHERKHTHLSAALCGWYIRKFLLEVTAAADGLQRIGRCHRLRLINSQGRERWLMRQRQVRHLKAWQRLQLQPNVYMLFISSVLDLVSWRERPFEVSLFDEGTERKKPKVLMLQLVWDLKRVFVTQEVAKNSASSRLFVLLRLQHVSKSCNRFHRG